MTAKKKTSQQILEPEIRVHFDPIDGSEFSYVLPECAIRAMNAYAAQRVKEETKDCYPKKFVKWLSSFRNRHTERVGEGWRITTYKGEEYLKERPVEEVFVYWTKKIMK